jgi:hypothetical protein
MRHRIVKYGFYVVLASLAFAAAPRRAMAADPYASRPRFALELGGGAAIGTSLGGANGDACTSPCSAKVPLGFHAVLRGVYQLPSGVGFGVDAGYLSVSQKLAGRPIGATPLGEPSLPGTIDENVTLGGLTLGASALYHQGDAWPFVLRIGAGVLVGSASDDRSGTFVASPTETFSVSASQSPSAKYFYVGPEARISRRFGDHFELGIGVEVLLLHAISQPAWDSSASHFFTTQTLGIAMFRNETVAADSFAVFIPGIVARYEP